VHKVQTDETFLTAVKRQVNKFDSCHLSQIIFATSSSRSRVVLRFPTDIRAIWTFIDLESCLFSERWTSPRARTTEERKPDVAEQIVEIRGRLNNTESLTDTILLPNKMLSEYSSKKNKRKSSDIRKLLSFQRFFYH